MLLWLKWSYQKKECNSSEVSETDYLSMFKSSLSCPAVLYIATESVTSNVKTFNGICAEMTVTKEN